MIDVVVGVEELAAKIIGVVPEISLHVFVNFLLQVDADGAVDTDDFIGADTGTGRDVPLGQGMSHITGS
jgi:hypothetical protein